MVLYLLPKGRQFITWVGGVCSNAAGLLLDTVSIHWVHVCERISHNPLCCSHCPSQVLSVLFRAAAILYWHTETEDAFCCGSAEVCSRLKGSPSHLWLLRKSSLCWTFFTRWHVFKLWCEHKVVYLFYLLPVYKEGSMLCVVDPLQSPHNEPPGHAGVQDQVVWTSSP